MNLVKQLDRVHESWKLNDLKPLLLEIEAKIEEKSKNKPIFPQEDDIFRCLIDNNLDDVSCCILGQDPYFNYVDEGESTPQAMGLAFSVPESAKIPPSLKNIYKELKNTYSDYKIPSHGNLSEWSKNGVLLLNTSLTVEHNKPNHHANTGWSSFTSQIIFQLVKREKPIVFLSWGRNAHSVTAVAEATHHKVIKTSHPSPLGATKSGAEFVPFLGSKCFQLANEFLTETGQKPIDWSIK